MNTSPAHSLNMPTSWSHRPIAWPARAGFRRDFQRPRPRSCGGFSLIEIVIAIGVAGFAILPIIGILSVGVSQSGETARNTVTTQILNQVNAEVRQRAFTNLANAAPLYFDDEGVPTTNLSLALWKTTYMIGDAALPAANTAGSFLSNARLVTVVTDFVPSGGGGAAIGSRSQTNFFYVNNRGGQ